MVNNKKHMWMIRLQYDWHMVSPDGVPGHLRPGHGVPGLAAGHPPHALIVDCHHQVTWTPEHVAMMVIMLA